MSGGALGAGKEFRHSGASRGIVSIRRHWGILGCRRCQGILGALGGIKGPSGGVRGALGAGRECRYSGATRGIGGIRVHRGLFGV